MNHQNKEENPYAPPKTALDFKPPEKGTKKQRIARVLLGGFSVPVLLSIFVFIWENIVNDRNEPFEFIFIVLGWFIFLFFLPSVVFAIIIENCFHRIYKMLLSLFAGMCMPYLIISYLLGTGASLPVHTRYMWFIAGVFATITSLFIMEKHRKHYQSKLS